MCLPVLELSSLDFRLMTSDECHAVAGRDPGGAAAVVVDVADMFLMLPVAFQLDSSWKELR